MKMAVWLILAVAFVAGVTLAAQSSPSRAEEEQGICFDGVATFAPLEISGGCFFVKPGEDAALVVGRAIIEDHYAPAGTVVGGFVGDTECGQTTVSAGLYGFFELRMLGAGERTDCAAESDVVEFKIGEVRAEQTLTWPRSPGNLPHFLSLTAVRQHAWYWFEYVSSRPGPVGTPIQALVGDAVCGETMLGGEHDVSGFLVPEGIRGFSRLIVPSEEIEPGCGRPGAIVSFVFDGVESDITAVWEPGVQRIGLVFSGDVDCDLILNAIDAALVLQFSAGLLAELPCQDMADVNSDGGVDSIDASLILQFEAGLIESLARAD